MNKPVREVTPEIVRAVQAALEQTGFWAHSTLDEEDAERVALKARCILDIRRSK